MKLQFHKHRTRKDGVDYVSVETVMRLCEVTRPGVYWWMANTDFPNVRFEGRRWVPWKKLVTWVRKRYGTELKEDDNGQ